MIHKIATLLILHLFLGCSIGPQPIDYGERACEFCKMNIVDKIHGTEIVTEKGKVYMFDATECMINFLNEFEMEGAQYYTNHYSQPEELIDATKATYLISQSLPSPMGAFITAFKELNTAEDVRANKKGVLYTWGELRAHMNQ